jgi:hypothetical protein
MTRGKGHSGRAGFAGAGRDGQAILGVRRLTGVKKTLLRASGRWRAPGDLSGMALEGEVFEVRLQLGRAESACVINRRCHSSPRDSR